MFIMILRNKLLWTALSASIFLSAVAFRFIPLGYVTYPEALITILRPRKGVAWEVVSTFPFSCDATPQHYTSLCRVIRIASRLTGMMVMING
jgi:hypothetical protein